MIQNPGDYVISFAGGYHQGFNLRLNHAGAVNFATDRWLPYLQSFKTCNCRFNLIARTTLDAIGKIVQNLPENNHRTTKRGCEDESKDDAFPEANNSRRIAKRRCVEDETSKDDAPSGLNNSGLKESREKFICSRNWRAHFRNTHFKDSLRQGEEMNKTIPTIPITANQRIHELALKNTALERKINLLLSSKRAIKSVKLARKPRTKHSILGPS